MLQRFQVEVRHEGLNKYRMITGTDPYVVEQKAEAQVATWDEQWRKKQERETALRDKAEMRASAAEQTAAAQETLRALDEILAFTLTVDDRVDWEALKDRDPFPTPKPTAPAPSTKPVEPQSSDARFQPALGFLDKLIASRRERQTAQARAAYAAARRKWEDAVKEAKRHDERHRQEYESALAEWERERAEHARAQAEKHALIDDRRRMYEARDPGAIIDYCDLVLSNSKYPDFLPQTYELDFIPETGILVVDYVLPAPAAIPRVKDVRYVQSREELAEVNVSQAEANRRYDSLLYQICLRTVHELFEADTADALQAIVFNGWVTSVDSATGKDVTACILSVQAGKQAFAEIDLSRIEPKVCFRSLKGVGSSKLHGLAAVAPLLRIDKQDRRFIEGREVIAAVDDGINLAAMDWDDFEHLIRELFEAEFAIGGGEVRVTQASRDGGVDAVAFDPDPIRGGKIVIQAKRYTNTVGVSAVRDLYGTVMNEGATKGILVTTADYGPDAYEFATGKPLTLLSGSNLLHLLQKHGHQAKIDLKEARALLKERGEES